MGVNVRWEDENGKRVEEILDPHMCISRLILNTDLAGTTCLQFIDPYGDRFELFDKNRYLKPVKRCIGPCLLILCIETISGAIFFSPRSSVDVSLQVRPKPVGATLTFTTNGTNRSVGPGIGSDYRRLSRSNSASMAFNKLLSNSALISTLGSGGPCACMASIVARADTSST